MPKSSIASRTPISFSSARSARIRSLLAEQQGLGELEQQRRRAAGRSAAAAAARWRRTPGRGTGGRTRSPRRAGRRPTRPARQARWRGGGSPRRQRAMSVSACRSTQSPSGTMSPVSSAIGMNWPGSITPQPRVRPADQRLEADDLAAVQCHDRLVDEGERGVLHGVLERRLHLAPPQHPAGQRRRGSAASAACPPPSPRTGRGPRAAAARPRPSLSSEVATPTVAEAITLASLSVNGSVNAAHDPLRERRRPPRRRRRRR